MTLEPNNQRSKILQGRTLRTLVVVIILGGAFFGLRWFISIRNDTNDVFQGGVDSVGMLEAIEITNDGQRVVAFDPSGKKIEQKGGTPTTTDRDPVWRPDGQRIFFVSDRDGKGFQLYRWAPRPDTEPDVRTQGSLGKSNPTFDRGAVIEKGAKDEDNTLLFIQGGFVLEYDPKDIKGHQLLPPISSEVAQTSDENGSGQASQFSALYGQLGDSFRIAKWCGNHDAIAAVMRSDRGDQLIVQKLPKPGEKLQPPVPLFAGERIDFDVNPKDGSILYTVQNVHFGSGTKIPVEQRPHHLIGMYKPGEEHPIVVGASRDDQNSFGSPAISPQGDRVIVTAGKYDISSATSNAQGLLVMPIQPGGVAAGTVLTRGEVFEPTWSPKGDQIAYAKRDSANRNIFVANADGTGEKCINAGRGNFSNPKFSPMVK